MQWLRRAGLSRLMMGGALCGMLLSGTAIPAGAQQLTPGPRTITVTGTGVATAPAETARVQIVVGANTLYGAMPAMTEPAVMAPASEVVATVPTPTAAAETSGAANANATPPDAGDPMVLDPTPADAGALVTIADPIPADVILTAADLTPVVDAIVATGVPEETITVLTGSAVTGWYGPGSASAGLIEFTLADPTLATVTTVVDAAARAATGALLLQQVGVEYGLTDCAELIEAARAGAFADGRTRAEALGQQFGAVIGAPAQVVDYSTTLLPLLNAGACPPTPDMAYLVGTTQAFNTPSFNAFAPAEARVITQLSISFEFELAEQ